MASNHISLYRKISEDLIDQIGLKVEQPEFSYIYMEEEKIINLPELEEDTLYINSHDSQWDPNLNNLKIKMKITLDDAKLLYGENKITHPDNKIKLGIRIYSRPSNFHNVYALHSIKNTREKQTFNIPIIIPENQFRDHFKIELFLYLSEFKTEVLGQANQVGMILNESPVYSLTIQVDGDGSLFPITEFDDSKGPFWRMERSWTDAAEDVFDASSVRLALNTAHPLFNMVKEGKQRTSQKVMNDIITQCIAMIIQEVIFIDKEDLSQAEESVENSILRIVKYWVDTYEIDTSSIVSITNTLNIKIEEQLRGDLS